MRRAKQNLFLAATSLSLMVAGFATLLAERTSSLHPVHLSHAEEEIECETCHEDAWTSMSGTDHLLPSKEICADCHDVDDEAECGLCHTDVDDPMGYAEQTDVIQLFPHATHFEGGMACSDCHGEAANPHAAEKSLCRECHPTVTGLEDCGSCHAENENLVPVSHAPGYLSFHGIEAGWDQASCANCHTQTDCEDCHAGDNVRPRSHGLDYAYSHSLEARSKEILCQTCHQDADYCVSCHVGERVFPENHRMGDWILLNDSGGRHAEDALFDMESCIACHDAGSESPICAQCHGE